jgi:hypothetical protein
VRDHTITIQVIQQYPTTYAATCSCHEFVSGQHIFLAGAEKEANEHVRKMMPKTPPLTPRQAEIVELAARAQLVAWGYDKTLEPARFESYVDHYTSNPAFITTVLAVIEAVTAQERYYEEIIAAQPDVILSRRDVAIYERGRQAGLDEAKAKHVRGEAW